MPLRDYAALGDGRTVALVARDGQVDWMPVPALHTPPVFAALVDAERGGRFELRPEAEFEATREYVPGTNVLRTTFRTAAGVVTVTDALVTGIAGRLPWLELARRVDGVSGRVDMRWAVVPGDVFRSGEVSRIDTVHGPLLRVAHIDLALIGSEHGRLDPHEPGDGFPEGPLSFFGAFTTAPGSRHLIALCGTEDEPIHLPDPANVDRGIDRTIASWETWSDEFDYEGPWQAAVQRSGLALKTLIFAPTGAIAAAATTGLPENVNGGKNYDYRFAWVRDLAYTVGALIRFGLREETHAAVSWVLKALKEHDHQLQIFFELDGTVPARRSRRVDAVGWNGIGPVLEGNDASGQLQLGVFADVVGIMRRYVEAGNILDERTSELLVSFTDEACRRWPEKDSGMWELPQKKHYVSSKIACWQAIDDALHLASIGEIRPSDDDLAHWTRNRELIAEWIAEHGWSAERGSYIMAKGDERLDASMLLHAAHPFGPRERMEATVAAIDEELSAGPLLYRYSGVEAEEGTFVACAFWLVEAQARLGRVPEASARMDELVALANDVGLYAEMISAESHHAFLGNLPQGLSHLALIDAAVAIRSQS
ncbi:MAG: glycoside hydrolase family 15 protein [Herbiconiux sp.]|nr:glycoside hydrolase family 15 protein [Herbiconiux sp.]